MIPPIVLVCLFIGTIPCAALAQGAFVYAAARDSMIALLLGIALLLCAIACSACFTGSVIYDLALVAQKVLAEP